MVYKTSYTRYQITFYLRLIGPVIKHCKGPKYYAQDCLKFFFLHSTLSMLIQVSAKSAHSAQKVSSIQKLPISKFESFLKSTKVSAYRKL